MPKVTIVYRLYPGGSSSRSYAIRKVVDLPSATPPTGTQLDVMPSDPLFKGRGFVVDRVSDDGEIIAKRVSMPDPDELKDLPMRMKLEEEGWTVGSDDTETDDDDE